MCRAGTILCSAATARLVRGLVRLTAMVELPSPGDVYQMLGAAAGVGPRWIEAFTALQPLCGAGARAGYPARASGTRGSGAGAGSGDYRRAGLGKSRLVAEFRRSLHGHRLTYLHGHCLAYRQATPYGPVLELLRQACSLTVADPPATMARKVGQRLAEVGVAPEDGAPYVLALLGVSPDPQALAQQSPQAVRPVPSPCWYSSHSGARHSCWCWRWRTCTGVTLARLRCCRHWSSGWPGPPCYC